jgi:hypothetical protein
MYALQENLGAVRKTESGIPAMDHAEQAIKDYAPESAFQHEIKLEKCGLVTGKPSTFRIHQPAVLTRRREFPGFLLPAGTH